MDTIWIIAQGIGIVGTVLCLIVFHMKDMKHLLKIKLGADIAWAVHYLLLGGYSGCATNVIIMFREIFFLSRKKEQKGKAVLIIFMGLNWIAAALTWNGVFSLIPAAVTTMATISFWQKSITVARIVALVNNVLMFTYAFCVGSYANMLSEILAFSSVLLALGVNWWKMQKAKKQEDSMPQA